MFTPTNDYPELMQKFTEIISITNSTEKLSTVCWKQDYDIRWRQIWVSNKGTDRHTTHMRFKGSLDESTDFFGY
jgi:hypothetical protein